ncbi:MAG: hypothetical protein WBA51_15175 [Erythrobacter sp.]
MLRTVTTPADLSADALDDLKGWLGISRPNEDDQLTGLLSASLAICEAFTGQTPIEQDIEESVPATIGRHQLSTRPARSVISAHAVSPDGARTPLNADAFEVQIDASGRLCIQIAKLPAELSDSQSVAVTLRAGIAPDWATLPGPLKQGIIRLAAFHYRDRETGRDATPPVSVTALWRPWRVLRLA